MCFVDLATKFQENWANNLSFTKIGVECGCGIQFQFNIVYNIISISRKSCSKFRRYRLRPLVVIEAQTNGME